jgi:hypothetical protein
MRGRGGRPTRRSCRGWEVDRWLEKRRIWSEIGYQGRKRLACLYVEKTGLYRSDSWYLPIFTSVFRLEIQDTYTYSGSLFSGHPTCWSRGCDVRFLAAHHVIV